MPVKDTREVPLGPGSPAGAQQGKQPAVPTKPHVIAQYLKHLPGSPGRLACSMPPAHRHLCGQGAQSQGRVHQLRARRHSRNRITRMIANTAAMELVTVRTEAEALLLEANLIKHFRPRYNVLLRDDKSFPFILITGDHRAPQYLKHRGARERKGEYFGPFASAGAVGRTINMLERAFLLRSCWTPCSTAARGRACSTRSSAARRPAPARSAWRMYAAWSRRRRASCAAEAGERAPDAQHLMQEASDRQDYEQAARSATACGLWRTSPPTRPSTPRASRRPTCSPPTRTADDLHPQSLRSGQNWGNRATSRAPTAPSAWRTCWRASSPSSTTQAGASPHPAGPRASQPAAACRRPLHESRSQGGNPCAQRGARTGVVEHALQNAREALGRKLAESSSQRTLLEGLRDRFGLPRPAHRGSTTATSWGRTPSAP